MCKFSSKLIAWLDKELPDTEAAAMDRHVPACRECREHADAFRRVSHSFTVYARAVPPLASTTPRRWWLVPAAVAAAVFAVFLLWPRRLPNMSPDAQRGAATVAPPVRALLRETVAPFAPVRHRRVPKRIQKQVSAWQPAEPTIQVIIPADALFPPGAFPEGVGFVADLKLAADGAPGGLVVRP